MKTFKSLIALVLPLVLLIGCGQDRREEVTDRYSSGEKKKVFIYTGEGAEEELIKRQFYTRDGALIRVENVAEEDTLYYGDLNPELTEKDGLEEFLTDGAWESGLTPEQFQYTADSLFGVTLDDERVQDASAYGVEYLPRASAEEEMAGRIVRQSGSGPDTVRIYPAGPDSMMWGGFAPHSRVDRDVKSTVQSYLKERAREKEQITEAADSDVILQPRANQMRYEETEFAVPQGEKIDLVLENTATSPSMRHNVVILNTNEDAELQRVGREGARAGMDNEYVPYDDAIIAYTPMAGPGEAVSVTFEAPEEPGEYGYVCTYPGHWATMRGTMHVVQ